MGFSKLANPDVAGAPKAALDKINPLGPPPEFLLHTGDIRHLARPEEFDNVEHTLPAVLTGLVAWQWQLEGQRLKGTLSEHLLAGLTAAVVVCLTWTLHFLARRKKSNLPWVRFLLEAAGTLAIVVAGHLGGFLSGVNGSS